MFTVQNLQLNRGVATASVQGKFSITLHTYIDINSTTAIIRDYLPPYLNQGANQDLIMINDHMLVAGSDNSIFCEIISLNPFVLGPNLFAESVPISVGATVAAVDNNAALISGSTLHMEQADKTHSGIVTATTQDIGGSKTFWANTKVIPENSFVVVPEEKPDILDFVVQTQQTTGGIQIQTDNDSNTMGYSFGTVADGANLVGLYYTNPGFPTLLLQGFNGSVTLANTGPVIQGNTTIISNVGFSVPGVDQNPIDLVVQSQFAMGGIQLQTDAPTNVLGYTFGSVTHGANIGGMYYMDNGGDPELIFNINQPFNPTAPFPNMVLDQFGLNLQVNTSGFGSNLFVNQINISDASQLSMNGPVVFDSTATFITGLNFGSGGGNSDIFFFKESALNVALTVQMGTATTTINYTAQRLNNIITLLISGGGSTAGQLTPTAAYVATTPIDAAFIPGTTYTTPVRIQNGSIFTMGLAQIDTSGIISIFNSLDKTTAFTASVTNGFDAWSISYFVP